ncbi:site-specific integrase [Romboutsia sp. CE17]|uniref:site-specific integrase n=1 Tax=Romboutsia sp. CE17 TaxID=2724150 RepID=UPI001442D5A4|nr:site-specific integrase [Romboutsia sp. CE17]QJA08774.1 site-specific integrase [Romboutsia sp. CE17]
MSVDLIEDIDIDLIQEEIYDPLEDVELLKEKLYKNNILNAGKFSKGVTNGKFEDDLWVVDEALNNQYRYIDFSELKVLKFKGVNKDDILVIKYWVASKLLDSFDNSKGNASYGSACSKYKDLLSFIKETNNFSDDFIDEKNGLGIKWYFDSMNVKDKTLYEKAYAVLDFVYSVEDYFLQRHDEVGTVYLENIHSYINSLTIERKSRELPRTRDILLLDHYIKKFFYNDDTVKEDDKLLYYPILLWWKITNIIPMRPSEFCTKIPRDCLIKDDDNFYLKIGRIKQRANFKRRLLPVLDRLKITKDIYELIQDYIDKTDIEKYGNSDTLISYRVVELFNVSKGVEKINKDKFSINILDILLKKFYSNIIRNKYEESSIKREVNLGDTRHFAFTSLLLQGIAPPYIAIMGGHRCLSTLDNYTCSTSYYADSEIVKYVNAMMVKSKENIVDNETIMEIVSKMPLKCPKDIDLCIPMYDVGFCMANFSEDGYCCEDETYCFKCSKWWCEPSLSNAKQIIEKVKNEEIKPRRQLYEQNVEFLLNLFENVGLEFVNGDLVVNEDDYRDLKRMALNIRSDIESMASDIAMSSNTKLINNIDGGKDRLYLDSILSTLSDSIE